MNRTPVICFFTNSAGDWGGASRVIFTNLRSIDRKNFSPLLLLPSSGPIEAELKQLDLRYLIWGHLTEPGNLFHYVRSLARAFWFFWREGVAVVHINGSNFWRPAELLAAWVLRIPIIAHYHLVNDKPGPFMKLCRAAICVSQYTAKQSLPATLDKPVIYNPIDLSRFNSGSSLREELGLTGSHTVVAFLGQIREIKGVQDFISMARRISNPNARFIIAGQCRDPIQYSGSYTEKDLEDLISNDTRIRYIGHVKAVENVYYTADIIVVPSRWQEPLGLINLEAGACHKPVVATRVGGIPEVINHGENGYLVEPMDIDALAERVELLIDHPELRYQMGISGRKQVEEKFTDLPIRDFEELLLRYAGYLGK